jgi:arabinose-5-phosphate isomerase
MTAGQTAAAPSAADLVRWGRETLAAESGALTAAAPKLDETFAAAVRAMHATTGKVVVTGLGKSGHVARKVASTLSSTGTSAFFLHPTEALHGDFGMLRANDCLIAIAYGGETQEVVDVARYGRSLGIPIIGITGKSESSLAKLSHFVLDGGVTREADVLNLAPTSSSTLAMALGDTLAVTLMRLKGFNEQDFASLHPGGSLGRRLSLVKNHMHSGERFPRISPAAGFHEVLQAVTRFTFGIVAVVGDDGRLLGAISDGDVRRALLKLQGGALTQSARELMTTDPKTISENALAIDALRIMNEKQITQLFVVESAESPRLGRPVGIVRLHDLLAAKIV